MPAWGLIPDSPALYYAGKAARSVGRMLKVAVPRGGGGGGASLGGGRGVSFEISKVIVHRPMLMKLLNTPSGGLWREMDGLGDRIVFSAKAQVGKRTGRLMNSIHKRHLGNFTGQYLWIGSTRSYALAHHEGTRPHVITPKETDGKLVFFKGNRMIVTKRVMHPGTKPNPYLKSALIKNIGSL
jgi:hypothetical protein